MKRSALVHRIVIRRAPVTGDGVRAYRIIACSARLLGEDIDPSFNRRLSANRQLSVGLKIPGNAFPSMNVLSVIRSQRGVVNWLFVPIEGDANALRKIFFGLVLIVILAVIAVLGGLFYIKPNQTLDLTYNQVPIKERALDMVRRMSLELIVTESDVNNLLKAELAKNPMVKNNVEVTGAKFTVNGDLLIADLNVLWKNLVPSSLRIVYRLQWENPNVIATIEEAKVKAISLPKSSISGFVIPLGDELPKPLKIEKIDWGVGEIKVKLKKPTIQDLQQLL
jgi:hypothetical protein